MIKDRFLRHFDTEQVGFAVHLSTPRATLTLIHKPSQSLRAHPVLLDESLAPHAGQVAVFPGHLRLALLQQHHHLAPLYLHFKMEEVKGGVRLNIL